MERLRNMVSNGFEQPLVCISEESVEFPCPLELTGFDGFCNKAGHCAVALLNGLEQLGPRADSLTGELLAELDRRERNG